MQQSVHMPQGHRPGRASVIAVSPFAPPYPMSTSRPAHVAASVELAAATLAADPPSYAQVIQEAVANSQALLTTFKANPTPILRRSLRTRPPRSKT